MRSNMRTSFTSKLATNGVVPRQGLGQAHGGGYVPEGDVDPHTGLTFEGDMNLSPEYINAVTKPIDPGAVYSSDAYNLSAGQLDTAATAIQDTTLTSVNQPGSSSGGFTFDKVMSYVPSLLTSGGQAFASIYGAVAKDGAPNTATNLQELQQRTQAAIAQQKLAQQQKEQLLAQAQAQQVAAQRAAAQRAAAAAAAARVPAKVDFQKMLPVIGIAGVALIAFLALRK
jgi:hypothetical protein